MRRVRVRLVVGLGVAVALLFSATGLTAKTRHVLKRAQRVKPAATRVYPGIERGTLTVKFTDDLGVYASAGRLFHADGRPIKAVNNLIDQGVVTAARPQFAPDKNTLRAWRERGEARSQVPLADLTAYFQLELAANQTVVDAAGLADVLNRSSDVELAFLEGRPEEAGDITPETPDYEPQQDYLKPAPGGVDAYAAWGYAGGNGTGVKICDIENGWHTDHEDLSKLVGNLIGGQSGTSNHGTAVMGEMLADSALSSISGIGYGVTGISYGAEGRMVSVTMRSTADALLLAAENLDVGDLILIELHQPGPNSTGSGQFGYVPMEWTPSLFDIIQTISANGIIVCEAAGNGSQDLNDPVYDDWFDTTVQHSGAIMCGAGAPPSGVYGQDRSRLGFSNYGMRVDLQGYGNGVVTTGYGGLFNPGDENQWYTATFSGTSSASPIVTASVACIQGRFKHVSGGYTMTAKEIRDLLYTTGSPQTGATYEHIGPRPDLAAAMPLVTALSAYANPRTFNVTLLDPPVLLDTLWLVNPHVGAATYSISVVDSLPVPSPPPSPGRLVYDYTDKGLLRTAFTPTLSAAPNATWITALPQSGSIPASDSLPVEITFDGSLLVGSYFGSYYKARIDVAVDGAVGPGSLPVSVLALSQDSLHGDTIDFVTATIQHRATSETNLRGWTYNDSSAVGWLYDGSFVVSRRATGDTMSYRDVFDTRMWRGRDFWVADSSWWPRYVIWRDSSMSDDSTVGLSYEAWVPVAGDSAEFVLWRVGVHSRGGPLPNVAFGILGDWDLPGSIGVYNLGGFDTTRQMVYQTGNAGYEDEAAGFAYLNGSAHGGVVGSNPEDVYPTGGFTDGRLFQQMFTRGFRVDSLAYNQDLHTILTVDSIGSLGTDDTTVYEIVVLSSRTGVPGLEAGYARAKTVSDSLRYLTCPIVMTGDVNLDAVYNASDIISLVNYVFKSGDPPLPIDLAGNVDCLNAVSAADIIYMVSHVFKGGPAPCDACTLY